MTSYNLEEKLEKSLDEFTRKRDMIGAEIIKIRESAKNIIDEMFEGLIEKLQAESEKIDATIDERLAETKKCLNSLREMDAHLSKAKSVFDATLDAGSFVRAF